MFILSIIATLFTAIALLPQVFSTYRSPKLHKIKISAQMLLIANSLTWVVFGWRAEESPLLFAAMVALISHIAIYLKSEERSPTLLVIFLYLPLLLIQIPILILELLAAGFIIVALLEMIRELESSAQELNPGRFILEIIEEALWGVWALLSSLYLIALPTLLYLPLAFILLSKIFIFRSKVKKIIYSKANKWSCLYSAILSKRTRVLTPKVINFTLSPVLRPTPLAFYPPD